MTLVESVYLDVPILVVSVVIIELVLLLNLFEETIKRSEILCQNLLKTLVKK